MNHDERQITRLAVNSEKKSVCLFSVKLQHEFVPTWHHVLLKKQSKKFEDETSRAVSSPFDAQGERINLNKIAIKSRANPGSTTHMQVNFNVAS